MKQQIAQITDIHLAEESVRVHGIDPEQQWQEILADIAGRGIKKIIFTGDIGDPASYEWFLQTLEPFEFTVMLGNHDTFRDLTKYYQPDYTAGEYELFHASEDAFFKWIFLDTSSNELSNAQLGFLARELLTRKKVMLFIHHPLLEVNTPIDRKYPLLNRDQVMKVLEESNREIVVFCGHYHTSDVAKRGKVTQYTTVGASLQYKKGTGSIRADTSVFGYRLIETEGENVSTREILNFRRAGFQEYASPALHA